jgi:hypothetical protein
MALFDDASLVVTPNGYKEGTLYSIKPTSGAGDMTVVRATTATRVNSAGLIEVVPYNLLTYSNTFSNAAWSTSQAALTSGQSGYDGTNNAWKFESSGGTSTYIVQSSFSGLRTQSIYAKAGTTSKFSIIVGGYGNGIQFDLSNGTIVTNSNNAFFSGSITSEGNGWYNIVITIQAAAATYGYLLAPQNLASGGIIVGDYVFIQNAQLVAGSVAKDYLRTETRLNIPRLDYSNGTCPSILVEPQRTNLVTYSNDFSNAIWIKSGVTITPNYGVSPDGTTNASRLQFNAPNTEMYQAVGVQTLTTSSFYVKGTAGQTIAIYNSFNAGGLYELRTLTGQWQRIEVTSNGLILSYSAISNLLGATATEVLVYGAQFELGNYSTSYIPTTSAAVTRNADVISKTGISSLIGQTEGTLFGEIKLQTTDSSSVYCAITSGSFTNFILFGKEAGVTPNKLVFGIRANGTNIIFNTSTSLTSNFIKCAIAYKSGNWAVYLNGSLAFSGSDSITFSSALNSFGFTSTGDFTGVGDKIEVNSAILFPTRLTNSELASLTTL